MTISVLKTQSKPHTFIHLSSFSITVTALTDMVEKAGILAGSLWQALARIPACLRFDNSILSPGAMADVEAISERLRHSSDSHVSGKHLRFWSITQRYVSGSQISRQRDTNKFLAWAVISYPRVKHTIKLDVTSWWTTGTIHARHVLDTSVDRGQKSHNQLVFLLANEIK